MNTVSIIFVLVAALAVVEVHSVEADATKAGQMKKMLNDVQKLESAIAEIKAAATKKDVEVKPVVKDAPKVEAPKVEKKVETMKDPLTPEEKKAVAALTPEQKAIAKEAVRELKAGNKALVAAGVSAAKIKQVEKQVQAVAKARFEALPADKKAAAEKKFFKELGEFEKLSPEARIAAVKAMQDKYKKQGADQVKQKVKSFIHKALDMVREKRAEQNDPLTPEEKKAVAALTPEEKAIAKEAVREVKAGNKALVAAGVSAAKIKEVEEKVEGIAAARFKALSKDKKAAAEKQFFKQLGEFEKLSPKARIAAVKAMQDKYKKQGADQVKDEVKSYIHKAFDMVMEKRAEQNDPLTPEEKKAVAALTPEEKAIAKEAVRELKAGNKALVAAGVSAAKIKEVEEKVEGIAEARFKALPADKKAAAEKQFFKQLGEFEKLSPKAKIAAVTAMQDKAKKQSADQVKDEVKSFIHKAFDTVMEKRAEREMADKEEQRRDMIKGAITRVYDAVRERIAQRQQKPKRDARTEKIHRIIDAVKQWIS